MALISHANLEPFFFFFYKTDNLPEKAILKSESSTIKTEPPKLSSKPPAPRPGRAPSPPPDPARPRRPGHSPEAMAPLRAARPDRRQPQSVSPPRRPLPPGPLRPPGHPRGVFLLPALPWFAAHTFPPPEFSRCGWPGVARPGCRSQGAKRRGAERLPQESRAPGCGGFPAADVGSWPPPSGGGGAGRPRAERARIRPPRPTLRPARAPPTLPPWPGSRGGTRDRVGAAGARNLRERLEPGALGSRACGSAGAREIPRLQVVLKSSI